MSNITVPVPKDNYMYGDVYSNENGVEDATAYLNINIREISNGYLINSVDSYGYATTKEYYVPTVDLLQKKIASLAS